MSSPDRMAERTGDAQAANTPAAPSSESKGTRPFKIPDGYLENYGIRLKRDPNVQFAGNGAAAASAPEVQDTAQRGLAGPSQSLPHLDAIQKSFGRHDVGGVSAHVGGAAAEASSSLGALAYATGNSVAFKADPDLHTAAHEAAHIVQQRAGVSLKGGVGQAGDRYERHADAVADAVVQGKSAEGLLDQMTGGGGGSAGVQRKEGHAVQLVTDEALGARAEGGQNGQGGGAQAQQQGGPGGAQQGAQQENNEPPDVFICFVTLAALPRWLPSETLVDHAFVAFGDGWSAGFTRLDGETIDQVRIHIPEPRAGESRVRRHAARRKDDPVSRSKTPAQIKQQIKTYAETVNPGRYSVISNNCGDWVKRALGQAWLVPETPGHIY